MNTAAKKTMYEEALRQIRKANSGSVREEKPSKGSDDRKMVDRYRKLLIEVREDQEECASELRARRF